MNGLLHQRQRLSGLLHGMAAALFLLVCLPHRSPSQSSGWEFVGNRSLAEEYIRAAMDRAGIRQLLPGGRPALERCIQTAYADYGFFSVQVDSIVTSAHEGESGSPPTVYLSERNQTRIGEVRFIGNDSLNTARLRAEMLLEEGTVLRQDLLQREIERLFDLYDRSGFPFARIGIGDIAMYDSAGGSFASIIFDVVEGAPFVINEIQVEGNERTDADVIIRETRVRQGELFNAEKVDDVRRRVEKLGFFTAVSEPQLYMRGSISGLAIAVTEGNTNLFDGIIGYQPGRTADEAGYLTGMVRLSFRNLFGTGRRFDARWERASRDIQELELRYLEPWLFGFPLNVEGGFHQRQQDTTYVGRALDATFSLLATENIHINLTGRSYSVIPSQSASALLPGRSSTLTGGIELVIDTRDNVYAPVSGLLFRSGYSGGTKTIQPASGEEIAGYLQHLTVDLSLFRKLPAKTVAALSLHGREVRGSDLDVSDHYRTGGANSLRGYREEQFSGTRIAYANLELRYMLSRRTFAFAFYDYGYIQTPDGGTGADPDAVFWRSGYGIGMRLETGLGIMSVSYALGEGDSVTDGKIHFGLVNEF